MVPRPALRFIIHETETKVNVSCTKQSHQSISKPVRPNAQIAEGRSRDPLLSVYAHELNLVQQFPLWVKSQVVAAISQSRRVLYAGRYTRFGNRGYKTGIAESSTAATPPRRTWLSWDARPPPQPGRHPRSLLSPAPRLRQEFRRTRRRRRGSRPGPDR